MASRQSSSEKCDETWKSLVDEVTECVMDNSPEDEILAHYLGPTIEKKYQVPHAHFLHFTKVFAVINA